VQTTTFPRKSAVWPDNAICCPKQNPKRHWPCKRRPSGYTRVMTTRLALILACLIVGFFVLDHYVLHLNAFVFLAKKMIDLMNYVAIWR